jgi:nitrogen-specific signal transduction histidine kinase
VVLAFRVKVTTIPPLPPNVNKSEILYGVEKAVGRGVYFMSNVKQRMDIFFDYRAPSIVVDIAEYRNGYNDIRKRGGKIRAFTEITKDNLSYCKKLMELVDELRHLDGVRGGMAVSESEYMATTVLQEAKPLTQVIYSNVKEVVEQGQYIFDTLWNAAVSAEQKIREIEEGVVKNETRIIENNPDEIVKQIAQMTANSNELSTCLSSGGVQYSYDYFFDIKRKLLDKQRIGQHKGLRYVTYIDRENVQLVKLYLESGIQVRHIKNLPPMSFGVSDKQIAATIEKMEGGKRVQSLLISNEPLYIKHFATTFEELWRNGVNALARIREIEGGIEEANIEVIHNPPLALDRYLDTVLSAKQEILLIFPTTNAFIRHQRNGIIHLLREIVEQQKVKVRILMPSHNLTEQTIKDLKRYAERDIDIRTIGQSQSAMATFLVVDKKYSLTMEIKDDLKESFDESVGLSVYSTSKAGVLSYVSIFENLWNQTELYEQLKVNEKMQREFINVAAHELRTPIQPILGLSEVLQSKMKDDKQLPWVDAISRNAKRLQRLTEDILDVTKIESQSLKLNKESFNLNEIVMSVIAEYGMLAKKNNIKMILVSKDDFIVDGDRGRLAQVLSNFISNAIKFTSKGNIDISLEKSQDDKEVILSVKDTGSGIDSDIMPRLFTKFATRSNTGTGLGLYISKNIVEAHGGRIWAENNSDGKGATFSFSIPVIQFKKSFFLL